MEAIQAFSVQLPQSSLIGEGSLVEKLEKAIALKLPSCKRLIRWAIVAIDATSCQVDGAYWRE